MKCLVIFTVCSYLGLGARGGSYADAATEIRVSSRYIGHYFGTAARVAQYNGRGVRTAQ